MSQPFVGEIRMFGGDFAPTGWAFCDGQALAIATNQQLFALLGTTYGGDGQTTFNVPDLRGRIPVHAGQSHRLGQRFGTEQETLTVDQMPAHSHQLMASNNAANTSHPGNRILASAAVAHIYSATEAAASLASVSMQSTAGGEPHSNMMPYASISFIIALTGMLPAQS